MENTVNYNVADRVSRYSASNCNTNCVTTQFPDDTVIAMAYVPFQLDKTAYAPEVALREGTLFPILNKPFCGRSVINE